MKNYNTFCQFHSELLAKWYPKWIACIRKKMPKDMYVSNPEIDSEITAQCMYLSTIFKGGSYPAFCNAYVEKRVLNVLYKEYQLIQHSYLEALADYDNNFINSYKEKHSIVAYEKIFGSEDYFSKRKELLYKFAEKIDNETNSKHRLVEMLDMLLEMNMHYDQIATKLGTNKMSVSRHVRKLVELVKNEIKETENEIC